jgi:hypothetical protein
MDFMQNDVVYAKFGFLLKRGCAKLHKKWLILRFTIYNYE